MLRLCLGICLSDRAQENRKKSKSDKMFLFLPNSLPKVITLPTYFLVKTMAKTLGMVAHMVTVRPKPTKAGT